MDLELETQPFSPHLPFEIQNASSSYIFARIIGPSQTGGVGSGQHQDPHLPNLSLMKKRWHSDILKALFTYLPTRWVIVGVDDVNFHTWSTTQPSKKFKPGKNMINQQKLRI